MKHASLKPRGGFRSARQWIQSTPSPNPIFHEWQFWFWVWRGGWFWSAWSDQWLHSCEGRSWPRMRSYAVGQCFKQWWATNPHPFAQFV